MASTELDALFIRGLRLLHSKSKDSTDQLRLLLDETLNQSKQAATIKDKHFSPAKLEQDSKFYLKKTGSREFSDVGSISIKQQYEDTRKREAEKRPSEKLKMEDIEIIHEAKIPKLESPQIMSCYPPSPDLPKLDHFVPKRVDDDTDCSDDNADAGDFAMEMGLACIICKQIDVSHGNQLVECQECHSLYHQECHKPPVTDYDVNDPRRVWYCAKCTKNMKKMATKTQKPSKPVTIAPTKESSLQTRFTKPETSQPSLVLPFKRTELKAPVTQGNHQSSANKPIGLAGLAANFSGRVTTASSSSVSSSSSSRPVNSKTLSSSMKPFSNLSALGSSSSAKTSTNASSVSSSSKPVNSSSYNSMSSSSATPPAIAKSSSSISTTSTKTGLLSAATSASSRVSSSSNNGGAKPVSCSLLMSADKRVQIMKKRAAKMQEKRRLSTK